MRHLLNFIFNYHFTNFSNLFILVSLKNIEFYFFSFFILEISKKIVLTYLTYNFKFQLLFLIIYFLYNLKYNFITLKWLDYIANITN